MVRGGNGILCLAALGLFCLPALAAGRPAQPSQWVTFKTTTDATFGKIHHQIDRQTIQQQGPYRIFWTRQVLEGNNLPLTLNDGRNNLVMMSQEFAVDCTAGKFGARFLDSSYTRERAARATLQKMRWVSLKAYPAVQSTVCDQKSKGTQ